MVYAAELGISGTTSEEAVHSIHKIWSKANERVLTTLSVKSARRSMPFPSQLISCSRVLLAFELFEIYLSIQEWGSGHLTFSEATPMYISL
jgi:hypothetical protein